MCVGGGGEGAVSGVVKQTVLSALWCELFSINMF